jgi:hypothetical protein
MEKKQRILRVYMMGDGESHLKKTLFHHDILSKAPLKMLYITINGV